MWLDDIYRAKAPAEIAAALLSTSPDDMEHATREVDDHRLVNLLDRVVDLLSAPREVDESDIEVPENEWVFEFGKGPDGSLFEPAAVAGVFAVSAAFHAAVKERTATAQMITIASTYNLDRLPYAPDEKTDPRDWPSAFRAYYFVVSFSRVTRAWLFYSMWLQFSEAEDPSLPLAADAFRRAWAELAQVNDMPMRKAQGLQGHALRHLASVVEPLPPTAPRALDFSDLPLLASRAESVEGRYGGRSKLPSAFQNQLAALLRSFNWRVVAAKPGEALPDFYIELPSGEFILVDAKSVGRDDGYSFPQSDRDSLRRYSQASGLLPTGRRVVCALIVGPSAGSGLAQRLSAAESDIGCDLRFATATQFLEFREAHPGGPSTDLAGVLHQHDHVLPDDWWNEIVAEATASNERLADYIRSGPSPTRRT
jgi:hypothetical protein